MMEVEEFQPQKKSVGVWIGMVRRTPGLLNIPELMKDRRGYGGYVEKPIFLFIFGATKIRYGVPT